MLDVTGSLDEIAGKLVDLRIDTLSVDEWTTSEFEQLLTAAQQQSLIQQIAAYMNGVDWRAPAPDVGGSKLAFAADDYDSAVMIGIWENPQTLLIGMLSRYDWPCGGIARASTSHWHPGSATSGGYSDALIILTETVALSLRSRDEDGSFTSVEDVDAATPTKIAEILTEEVNGWDALAGHGINLMSAHLLGFSEGDVGLVGGDNTGYEILDLHVQASDAVLKELREMHPEPSPSEAAAWLELAQGLCEQYDDENDLVENLTEIVQDRDAHDN